MSCPALLSPRHLLASPRLASLRGGVPGHMQPSPDIVGVGEKCVGQQCPQRRERTGYLGKEGAAGLMQANDGPRANTGLMRAVFDQSGVAKEVALPADGDDFF